MFDLIIFPLSLETGREQYELPGLLVANAPRRSARMRAQDQLVLYFKLGPTSSRGLTTGQQREILSRLADTYFTFSGSVTAGLRTVAAQLNDFLFSRNAQAGQEGQMVGLLNMAVIHGERMVVAHSGPTHSFVLTKNQVLHFDDSQGQAGRGLGLSRQATPRFYQTPLEAGDLLVLCADPPAAWSQRTLSSSPQLSFDQLRRRLLGEAGADLQVGVVRFQAGKGQISHWRPGEDHRPSSGRLAGDGRRASRPGSSTPQPVSQEAIPQADLSKTAPVLPENTSQPVPAANENLPSLLAENVPVSPEAVEENLPLSPAPLPEPLEPPAPDSAVGIDQPTSGGWNGTEQQRQTRLPQRSASPDQAQPRKRAGAGQGIDRSTARTKKSPAARPARQGPGAIRRGLAALGLAIGTLLLRFRLLTRPARAKIGGGLASAATRALPRKVDAQGRPEPFFNLSPGQMLAVALIIPLVVVTVATTVYFQTGRREQFRQRLAEAQQVAQQAEKQKDPAQQREKWKQAYALLLEADRSGQNDESRALEKQVISALDGLEGLVRLNYQPVAQNGFSPDVKISRIVASLTDVYLLDSNQGRILRLYRTASGYELDPTFNCGPGQAGTLVINPLIDLVALPPNNEMHSTVMGIDAEGNLVYCSPSQSGFDSRPLAQPDPGWGKIVGMTLYNDSLYVLDPKGNAVYRYDGQNSVFSEKPHLYFDETIPQMNDVVGLAVDQEFLYLLHQDGRMTLCESSGFAYTATKCTDPAPYGDTRPGYDPAPLTFQGANFIQIQTTQPPDPSLFALDAANKSIYHLSLRRLNLQRQYRDQPDGGFPLPNESPTAFAISPNRRVLLAFGDQLYFAPIP